MTRLCTCPSRLLRPFSFLPCTVSGRPTASSTAVNLRLPPRPPRRPHGHATATSRAPVRRCRVHADTAAVVPRPHLRPRPPPRRRPPDIPSTRGLVHHDVSHDRPRGRGCVRGGDVLRGLSGPSGPAAPVARRDILPAATSPALPSPAWSCPRVTTTPTADARHRVRAAPRPRGGGARERRGDATPRGTWWRRPRGFPPKK